MEGLNLTSSYGFSNSKIQEGKDKGDQWFGFDLLGLTVNQ